VSQVSPNVTVVSQRFVTANPRRGGGCRGFWASVTDFLVNIKKQGKREYIGYIEGGYVTL